MEDLFRIMLARPPVAPDPDEPVLDLTRDTDFQQELNLAVEGISSSQEAVRVSKGFMATPGFIGLPRDNTFDQALADFASRLDDLAEVTPATVSAAAAGAFGREASDVVGDRFDLVADRLGDSLIAIKVLQEEHSRPVEDLVVQLRLMEIVRRIASDPDFPKSSRVLSLARRSPLQLPNKLKLPSKLSTRAASEELLERRKVAESERGKLIQILTEEHARLRTALDEIAVLEPRHFKTSPQKNSEKRLPPPGLRAVSIASRNTEFLTQMRELQLKFGELALDRPARTGEANLNSPTLSEVLLSEPSALAGTPAHTPQTTIAFTIDRAGVEALGAGTQKLLGALGLNLEQTPLDHATDRIQAELDTVIQKIEQTVERPVAHAAKMIGGTLVTIDTPFTTEFGFFTGGVAQPPVVSLDERIPHTRGEVTSAGVADLLIVRQQLTGYVSADVAHVENVLKGERKLREHNRRKETQVITFSETETSKTEERELETTSRFEMARESSETIKEDVQLKAGLNISGKYGPVVEFAVSAEGSYQRSKEQATKTASKFSQDVTERSSRKVAERVLERTTMQVTNEVTEKNNHELDNVDGPGHISGVYQWVNKVYQAQMYNYGLRAMFDFMVPEPAAFLTAAMMSGHRNTLTVTKPPGFPLKPAQVTEQNYGFWVRLYAATDVTPPPELFKTAAMDFKAGGGDKNTNYNHSGQIAIDDGYRAVYGSVGAVKNIWENDHTVDIVLGQRTHRLETGNWSWTTRLDSERGSVPVAIDTWHVSQVAVAIEVKCQRTTRAMDKWRLKTHGKLMTAYRARLAEYEEKLAQLEMQAGVAIHGRNPAANLVTIKHELKKTCISVVTDQQYELFDAIETSPTNGLPQPDLHEAAGEGPYVRFFEQAFEWENMTWVTYPYFWARKSEWDEMISYEDPDPVFSDFLRAGYARVSVPARPGFEGAIDHFLTFGELWNGGPLPTISNPQYLPIAEEIAEQLGRPGAEVPQGDPWPVTVPTTLVKLRSDDALPLWEQDPSGAWVEA